MLAKDKKIVKSPEESSSTLEAAKDRKTQRSPGTATLFLQRSWLQSLPT